MDRQPVADSPASTSPSRPRRGRGIVLALTVLLLGLFVSGIAVRMALGAARSADARRFQGLADRVQSRLLSRIDQYQKGLLAAGGLFHASKRVERREFSAFVRSSDFTNEFPGALGIGFVTPVKRGDGPSFTQKVRASGESDFLIRSSSDAADLFLITYIEPHGQNPGACGYDIGSDAIARAAAMQAAADGTACLTHSMKLVQAPREGPGFLYLLPFYDQRLPITTPDERRAALQGWIYMPILLHRVMSGIGDDVRSELDIEVYEGATISHGNCLVDENGPPLIADLPAFPRELLHLIVPIHIAGQTWTLALADDAGFQHASRAGAWLAGLLGGGSSLLLSLMTWSTARARRRAECRVEEVTDNFRGQSEELARLALVAQCTGSAVLLSDQDRRITWVNNGFFRLTGYSLDDVKGRHALEFLPSERTDAASLAQIDEGVLNRVGCRLEVILRDKAGRDRWCDLDVQPLRDEHNEYVGTIAILTDITQQVTVRNRLTSLVETMSEGLLVVNAEGAIVDCNPAAELILGAPRAELIGRFADDPAWRGVRTDGTDYPLNEFPAMVTLRTDRPLRNVVMGFHTPDGQLRWISLNTHKLAAYEGEVGAVLISVTDITDRRLHEDRLALTVAAAGLATWELDFQSERMVVNDLWSHTLGYDDREIAPTLEAWKVLLHPDDLPHLLGQIERCRRGDAREFRAEHRALRSDGTWAWTLGVGKVTEWDRNHRPLRAAGIRVDISALKNAEARVRASEERLRLVIDTAMDAVVGLDEAGCVTLWNAQAERDFGYTAAQAVGRRLHELVAPPDSADSIRLAECIATREPALVGQRLEIEAIDRNGRKFPVEISISPRCEVNGHGLLSATIRDISKRKAAEDALLQAHDAAQAASQAKSEFLANMSHEIRTPMNGIMGIAGLLLDTALSLQQRQFVEIMQRSSESLLSVINDILDFSKIEARKLDLEISDFDVATTFDEVVETLSFRAQEKNIELVAQVDPAMPALLRGDRDRLRQILLNLGGNAIKFTDSGQVLIRAGIETENESSVMLRVEVSDTGIGIAAGKVDGLFSPFTQVDASITRRFGGTGLGLAICRQLCGMMGGEIGVESQEGVGSTFWFTVRLEKASDHHMVHAGRDCIAGARVLIVDNHEGARNSVTAVLEQWGCRVAGAATGESALTQLRDAAETQDPFRVALVDASLPTMEDGHLLREIRSIPEIRDTRLVALVPLKGRPLPTGRDESGAFAQITRPIRQAALRATLTRALLPGRQPPARNLPVDTRGSTDAPPAQKSARILLAEDNHVNQLVAVAQLRKLGYEVDAVVNGREAIRSLRQADYALVLMDCQMPEMDGFEATRLIRSSDHPRARTIPIIAITAHAMACDRQHCLDAGMSDYLSKPVRPAELARMLEKWLAAAGTPGAHPPITDAPKSPPLGVPSTPSVFDEAALLNRAMGNRDLARQVSVLFVSDFPQQLAVLRCAADADTLRRAAHAAKGAASTVGAERMQRLAMELEMLGKAGEMEMVDLKLSLLEREFELLCAALSRGGWLNAAEIPVGPDLTAM